MFSRLCFWLTVLSLCTVSLTVVSATNDFDLRSRVVHPQSNGDPRRALSGTDHRYDDSSSGIVREELRTSIDALASLPVNEFDDDDDGIKDYHTWLGSVVQESLHHLCPRNDAACEGGVFTAIVEGMRFGVRLRDYPSVVDVLVRDLGLDRETAQALEANALDGDALDALWRESYEDVSNDEKGESNVRDNGDGLRLGVLGAREWSVVVLSSEEHALRHRTTHGYRRDLSRNDHRRLASDLVAVSLAGGRHAVRDLANDTNVGSHNRGNVELAAAYAFVAAALPVVMTDVRER